MHKNMQKNVKIWTVYAKKRKICNKYANICTNMQLKYAKYAKIYQIYAQICTKYAQICKKICKIIQKYGQF